AAGIVVFNRFYQPDIDLETLTVTPALELSSSSELRLPLRWIAVLREVVDISLAATGGVHEHTDVLKVLLAGADVAMMASALLRHGPEHVTRVIEGLRHWLDEHEYASVEQLRGSMSLAAVPDPERWTRANYIRMLTSYSRPLP
ncbi:MAG: dihydroorotate dehydrogenase-like protein, partial [Actinomyces sp.]